MAEQTLGSLPRKRKRLGRAEKKAATRAALLEAAARVFGRGGFYGASVEEIAEEAGFSRGAVYSNFESKEDLFMTLLEERDQEWAGAISNQLAGEEQIETALLKGGTAVAELHERNRDWWLLFFELGTYASRDRMVELRMARMYAQARARVAQMIDARCEELKISLPMPTDDVAAAVVALSNGFYLERIVDPERFPPDFLGHLLLLFFGGLAALGTDPNTGTT